LQPRDVDDHEHHAARRDAVAVDLVVEHDHAFAAAELDVVQLVDGAEHAAVDVVQRVEQPVVEQPVVFGHELVGRLRHLAVVDVVVDERFDTGFDGSSDLDDAEFREQGQVTARLTDRIAREDSARGHGLMTPAAVPEVAAGRGKPGRPAGNRQRVR
jgi:hypothetical protein